MSYSIKDVNYLEEGSNKFYILIEFEKDDVFRISYELINSSYKELKERNKNISSNTQAVKYKSQIEAEKIEYTETISTINTSKKKIDVIYEDFTEDYFKFYLEEKRLKLFILKKKRNIKFINKNDEENEYSIYSKEQIDFWAKKENLAEYSEMFDSENKKIYNLDITKIARIEYKKEKEKINPFDKYNEKKNDIKYEYTLNFDSYFKTKNFKFIKTKKREELNDLLDQFINDTTSNIKGITGISGIGKSISLLDYLSTIHNNKCYFNLKNIHEYYMDKFIVDEAFKLFSEKAKFDESLKNLKKNINYWEKIDYFLSCSYEGIFESKIIVLDQYKTDYDPKYCNILKLAQKYPNYKFIVCSSINDDYLRDDIIYSNFYEIKNSIIPYIYICDNLCNVENESKNDREMKDLLTEFDYLPKFYNDFLVKYGKANKDNINKYLFQMKEDYYLRIKMFYWKRNINLCKHYKIIQSYINNKVRINKRELGDIIDCLPLKYIKIMKDKDYFVIDYSFKFLANIFNCYYKEEISTINEYKILNTNKRGEIGNIFDDVVNEMFSLGKTYNNIKIGHKIIVDTILNFDKIFNVLTDVKDNGKEHDILFYEYFNKNAEIYPEIIFSDENAIFIEQFYQGKNYDGAVLIPCKNNKGVYELFLYQTSINKDKKYYRNEIYNDYLEIKYKFESFFGIKINKGYFSFILYYEEKDMITISRCKNEYINYFFYSIDKKMFVDSKGKEITSLIYDNSLIYKKDLIENLDNIKKNIKFFENCFHYKKGKSLNNNNNGEKEKVCFLAKKRLLSSININENKYQNLINKKRNLEMINAELEEQAKAIENKNIGDNYQLDLKEENDEEEEIITIDDTYKNEENKKNKKRKSKKTKEDNIKNESEEKEPKYDNELNSNIEMTKLINDNDILEKKNKELFNKINKDLINEDENAQKDININKDKYNVKEALKYKQLPKTIKDIFNNYNNYIEYGNMYFLGLNITPKFPYILICKESNNFIFICYEDNDNIKHIIDISTKKELNDKRKLSIFEDLFYGKLEFHFWELFK